MWPDLTLLLREFARRPTVDRPEHADPGLDIASGNFIALLEAIFSPLFAPRALSSSQDYSAHAR